MKDGIVRTGSVKYIKGYCPKLEKEFELPILYNYEEKTNTFYKNIKDCPNGLGCESYAHCPIFETAPISIPC